jgi:hypothetical protein
MARKGSTQRVSVPLEQGNAAGILEMARRQASEERVVLLQNGIRESARGSAQQKEKFTGPQKNVQQAAALQIVDVIAMQRHIKRAPRALFDECAPRSGIQIHAPDFLAARINALQIFVAKFDEVVQAKILLSQRSHSGFFTKIHCTDLVLIHR